VNHQLLIYKEMKETRRSGKRGQPKNPQRSHPHAPFIATRTR
jgi:hypothetical protein